jgi:hypothetical protein
MRESVQKAIVEARMRLQPCRTSSSLLGYESGA